MNVKLHTQKEGLIEREAYILENVLINHAPLVQGLSLTNLVKGHGSKVMLVEEIEEQYGFQELPINEIATDELILGGKERCLIFVRMNRKNIRSLTNFVMII